MDNYMLRLCVKCKIPKPLDEFHVQKQGVDGRRRDCKFCKNKYRNSTRNIELGRKQAKKWNDENRERRCAYRKSNRQRNIEMTKLWRLKNIDKCRAINNEYAKSRRKSDPVFNLSYKMRCLLARAFEINGYKKGSKTEHIIGCSFSDLSKHLESSFHKNYGVIFENKYEVAIDHIIPLSTAMTEQDVITLNHYSNLQYLLKIDNLRKSDKMEYTLTQVIKE